MILARSGNGQLAGGDWKQGGSGIASVMSPIFSDKAD